MVTAAALVLAFSAAPTVEAQQLPHGLRAGAELKLSPVSEGEEWIHGSVRGLEGGWVAMQPRDGGGTVFRRLDAGDYVGVRQLRPTSYRLRKGLQWGVFLGASLGGIAGPVTAAGIGTDRDGLAVAGMSAVAGAAAGSAVGLLLGRIIPSRHWQYVQLGPQVR